MIRFALGICATAEKNILPSCDFQEPSEGGNNFEPEVVKMANCLCQRSLTLLAGNRLCLESHWNNFYCGNKFIHGNIGYFHQMEKSNLPNISGEVAESINPFFSQATVDFFNG